MAIFARIVTAISLMAAIVLALCAFAGRDNVALTGIVSDSMCGAKHMMSDDTKCTRTCAQNGSQYALVVKDRIYKLHGKSEEFDKLASQKATVIGELDGETIQVASVTPAQDSQTANNRPSPSDPSVKMAAIEGLVRDVACPIQNKEATARNFNLKCAQDCAKLESPLIILTDDGTLYTPISESMPDTDQRQRLMPFLGKYVRVRGQVFERAGTHAIAIKDIVELKNVRLVTDAQ
jgi:hypothetical protein